MKILFDILNKLLRPLSLYRTANPDYEEAEEVACFEEHLSLMIKLRWVFSALCLSTAFFFFRHGLNADVMRIAPPLILLFICILAYNGWYQYSLRQFSHLRGLRQLQILVDVAFAILIIHYTGGLVSWAWVLFPLLVIEAAIFFDSAGDTWLIAVSAIVMYGLLLALEFHAVIPRIEMPFFVYTQGYGVTIRWLCWGWVAFITVGTAIISTRLLGLQRDNQAKMEELIIRDQLTGLYNRKHFLYSLKSEIERARCFERIVSVLFINVDNFKTFNNSFGYKAGNKLLSEIANILLQNISSGGEMSYNIDLPFRCGGDKFAIILPETSPSEGVKIAEQLKDKVAVEGTLRLAEWIQQETQNACPKDFKITVSIGVAGFPSHGNNIDEVVQSADEALYAAKEAGGNTVVLAKSNPQPE